MAPHRLWLVRHGQSIWNASGLWQGQADPPLSELGHHQAALLAERLAKVAPAAIYASDLQRARQTAAPLAEALGLSIVPHPGLREIDVGRWSGKTWDGIVAAYPDEVAAWQSGEDIPRGGGERFADLTRRAVAFLDELATRHDGEEVVAVTHGGWIRAAFAHALNVKHSNPAIPGSANTGITVLRYLPNTPSGLRVLVANDHAHLADATP